MNEMKHHDPEPLARAAMSANNQVGTSVASAITRPNARAGGGVQVDQRGGFRGLFRRTPQTPGRSYNAGAIARRHSTTAARYATHETCKTAIVN